MPRDANMGGDQPDLNEAPIGDLFGRLIDDGKAYAKAEVDLVRVRAEAQATRAKLPAILLAGAIAFGFAGVIALILTLVLTLAAVLGPLAGGLVATLVTMLVSLGLGLAAFKSWKAGE